MNNATQTVLIGVLSVWALLHGPTEAYSQRAQVSAPQGARPIVPSFKIVGKDRTALSIVVPPETTEAQLVALVNNFRAARGSGVLAKLIPPTTPNGSRGPYAVVMVFVFTDPAWASSTRLHAFIDPRTSAISASEKAFGKSIRAYYYYTALGPHEIGSIGYEDEGHTYTATYKKLF